MVHFETASEKASRGNYFEDFEVGREIVHATPRTLSAGDGALYAALYGSRFPVTSSDPFARAIGHRAAPLDDLLVFHVVFGKTVPDLSLNAVANLGYADLQFHLPVHVGDTLSARSTIIGLRENSNGKTGTVYVRTTGLNQDGAIVLDFVRWVMVHKRNPAAPAPDPVVPELPDDVPAERIRVPDYFDLKKYDAALAGSDAFWEDYAVGERIDHQDGMTIEEAEHMMATRLYQNTARVHFNAHVEKQGRFGRRIVYGGHVISLTRALSFNGLANAFAIAAVNGGRHVAPAFAGDTVYAWSEVLASAELAGRRDAGALRIRSVASKDTDCARFPYKQGDGAYDPSVILDLDYWVLMPRRAIA